MNTIWIAVIVFLSGYLINVFYITVLYHRGLTHNSVILSPIMIKWMNWTGVWVTGLDPKAWAAMHRLHHMHSDTERDPHSPLFFGVIGVAIKQLRSYESVLRRLMLNRGEMSKLVADIPFTISVLNRKGLWMVPYVLHALIGVGIALLCHSWLVGLAYFTGILSHPVQGWMVNALAHKYGYRNFSTKDQSTNNWIVSFLVFGEGYQNNHHARPKRANFAIHASEIDLGYLMCVIASKLGMLKFRQAEA